MEKRASSCGVNAGKVGDERTVGQYVVLAKLGQGGFGVIFRVRSLSKSLTFIRSGFR